MPFRRLKMKLVGWLLRDEVVEYAQADDDEAPRHFQWHIPEGVKLTGFDGFPCGNPPRTEGWGDAEGRRGK